MKTEKFKVESKGSLYSCQLDAEGMVWYEDKFWNLTNTGQNGKVRNVESAKKLIVEMLKCVGL
jgi:hypothetical protein